VSWGTVVRALPPEVWHVAPCRQAPPLPPSYPRTDDTLSCLTWLLSRLREVGKLRQLGLRFSQRDLTPWMSRILDLRWFLLAFLVCFSTLKVEAARSSETSQGFVLYYTASYPRCWYTSCFTLLLAYEVTLLCLCLYLRGLLRLMRSIAASLSVCLTHFSVRRLMLFVRLCIPPNFFNFLCGSCSFKGKQTISSFQNLLFLHTADLSLAFRSLWKVV
jgi:hypothetical protein